MEARGAAHFEDLLTLVPNMSASSGASRQRFFQIRGIGERSQFIEPVNPSVVLLQDGVDISGLGGALTSFDTAQIDILRGPQGAIMGAGALAGLISVETATPSAATELNVAMGWKTTAADVSKSAATPQLPRHSRLESLTSATNQMAGSTIHI